ncbi:hypothetical protein IMG5_124860 [Ichthyophthirius multifiliis]|uniref:Uncharacterized protein n=1 Tax=Ichthyophthirius multifiliis TaxID=5932 RepID=G0QVN2_ICHMU|nr:hypothetical protein IMG5_124860 [Ichthyophthirius multifiliis]EGR30719.1 hypothetical protein IMG5_124860 [Ichthyophthirius multifiliis]|eukprot:XP_004032306.1 hypothetical protein IMG5_124860 [Ichthyophthirius multifiliis]
MQIQHFNHQLNEQQLSQNYHVQNQRVASKPIEDLRNNQQSSTQYSVQNINHQPQQYTEYQQAIQNDNYEKQIQPFDQQQIVYRNNLSSNTISNTELRRRYPYSNFDKKNEWIGVERHLAEVNEEIKNNEWEINHLRQKELLSELEKKAMWQLQQKQAELRNKKSEHEDNLKKLAAFQEEESKNKSDMKMLQQNMAQYYNKQQDEQARKKMNIKFNKKIGKTKFLFFFFYFIFLSFQILIRKE